MVNYRNDPYTGYESLHAGGLHSVTGTSQKDWSDETVAMVRDARAQQLAAQKAPDMVHQPAHYARFVIEPVTFVLANKLPYDVGNVVKYVCRYDAKNGVEDLEKAKRYVEIIIERVRRETRIANGESAATVWSKII